MLHLEARDIGVAKRFSLIKFMVPRPSPSIFPAATPLSPLWVPPATPLPKLKRHFFSHSPPPPPPSVSVPPRTVDPSFTASLFRFVRTVPSVSRRHVRIWSLLPALLSSAERNSLRAMPTRRRSLPQKTDYSRFELVARESAAHYSYPRTTTSAGASLPTGQLKLPFLRCVKILVEVVQHLRFSQGECHIPLLLLRHPGTSIMRGKL